MKFLIIRLSSIGDIVLMTPAIRCLKKKYPDAAVHFLTKKSFAAVTESNPWIDQFHYFDNNFSEIATALRQENFDCVVDLHKNLRTLRLKQALNTRWLSYRKLSVEKFLLTKLGIDRMPGRHITLRSLDALSPLGVVDDGLGLDYYIPAGKGIYKTSLPSPWNERYIALVIGASYFTKKLPVAQLILLCQRLAVPVILIGGKDDMSEGALIAASDPDRIYNACGTLSLHQSADLVRQSEVVISHDTGLQYIACAFGKPVMAIWGGTSPKLDVEPFYGSREQIEGQSSLPPYQNFIVPDLPCQPCSNFGTKTCPKGHFKCMKEQDIKKIAEKALTYYEK